MIALQPMSNSAQRALVCAAMLVATATGVAAAATGVAVATTSTAAGSATTGSGYAQRPEVREFAAELAAEHGFRKDALLKLFAQAQTLDSTLRLMLTPHATT